MACGFPLVHSGNSLNQAQDSEHVVAGGGVVVEDAGQRVAVGSGARRHVDAAGPALAGAAPGPRGAAGLVVRDRTVAERDRRGLIREQPAALTRSTTGVRALALVSIYGLAGAQLGQQL
jgi:hypothetical protein